MLLKQAIFRLAVYSSLMAEGAEQRNFGEEKVQTFEIIPEFSYKRSFGIIEVEFSAKIFL